jgi:hypothetical protein
LAYHEAAREEARRFLNEDQYAHVVGLFAELPLERDPGRSLTCDVESIDQFFELRDKGGVLGKINFRAYFSLHRRSRTICVLACVKKEQEGRTPNYVVKRVRNRLRMAASEYGD